jgi:hypothetical protein
MPNKIKIRVKNSGIVRLQTIIDKIGDGDLFIGEATKNIPFKIKRIFFITRAKVKKPIRGEHAHKKFKQAIFCINGSFVLNLDDGRIKQSIFMNDPSLGVLLGSKLWHTMTDISRGCNILVLADSFYREDDYIRNYDEFLKYIGKK